MIGGYVHSRHDREFEARIRAALEPGTRFLEVRDSGFFFSTAPWASEQKPFFSSSDLVALSEDLLVTPADSGRCGLLDLESGFLPDFLRRGGAAFDAIQSDFRMAVASNQGGRRKLFLASNRAGSGRIYYRKLADGMVFCSDLRFLLKIVPFEVDRMALYAILKYGSSPDPLTIGRDVFAVPVAHFLQYDPADGKDAIAPYFKYRFAEEEQPRGFDEQEALERVEAILRKSAKLLGGFRPAVLLSGGIDSSLYGCYLDREKAGPWQGFYCSFGRDDPEYPYACAIAQRLGVPLQVATMGRDGAMRALDDAVRLTDHPFADFSSLPISFLLPYVAGRAGKDALLIECNGGDDCFGFPALLDERKHRIKHAFPGLAKKGIARALAKSTLWKWETSEGAPARVAALADVHESSYLNYFLVQAPVNYLGLDRPAVWDGALQDLIERTASSCGENYPDLGYEAKTTIRQLIYINSARWASKALSVGESLGLRVVYPYIWRDVLLEQGKLPWNVKVRAGVVKWPLKRLLEEFMPVDFIYRKKSGFVPPFAHWLTDGDFNDKVRGILLSPGACVTEIVPARVLAELLDDARAGRRLRFPILNFLWGAIFSESWIRERQSK